jgi:hypothetical protein
MSDKIYLVARGSYSDYAVYAAFTSKQSAQEAIDRHAGGDVYEKFEIEEIPLNPDVVSSGKRAWRVIMDYDSGDKAEAKQIDLCGVIDGLDFSSVFKRYGRTPNLMFSCECYADDEAHAIKIANERRAMYLATRGEK